MIEKLIINKFGSDFTRSGDEMLYHCPFCEEMGKRNNDRKLYVNKKSGKFICFRCGTTGVVHYSSYLARLYNSDIKDVSEQLLNFISNDNEKSDNDEMFFSIPQYKVADYPDSFQYKYLIGRNITEPMMRDFDLRCFGEGSLHNRIVIPNRIVNKNWTDFYTARALFPEMKPKYFNSKFSKKDRLIFNIDNIFPEGDMIINEGCINSIIAGKNSVALFGKFTSDEQLVQILRKHPHTVYISLDYDARKWALSLAKRIHDADSRCEVRLVDLPDGEDASSLGKDAYFEFIDNSKVLYYGNDINSTVKVFENFIDNERN